MNNYFEREYDEIKEDLIVFSTSTLAKYFKEDSFDSLYDKLETYFKENLETLKKVKTPEKYLFPLDISEFNLIETTNIEVCDDANLTLVMLLKTFENIYIPNKELKFNQENIIPYIVFYKKDLDE